MKISVLTIFPEMIAEALRVGVVGQALKEQKVHLHLMTPREETSDTHRTVDDRPYGGGDGMVMLADPLKKSLEKLVPERSPKTRVVYLSPQGSLFSHKKALELADMDHLVLISGRYAGVDQRFLNQCVDEEISIGDYVLSGGELAALVLIDAVIRLKPGVLGHANSTLNDSFALKSGLLESPQYTRPAQWENQTVPKVLLSGHHEQIEQYREFVSYLVTFKKRPELLKGLNLSSNSQKLIAFARALSKEETLSLGLSPKVIEDFVLMLGELK